MEPAQSPLRCSAVQIEISADDMQAKKWEISYTGGPKAFFFKSLHIWYRYGILCICNSRPVPVPMTRREENAIARRADAIVILRCEID